MDIKKIEDFLLSKVTDNEKTITILNKWEKEILFMMNKKIKQKIIIEFLFENDKILKNRYNNEKGLRTFQSLLSKFCNKLNEKKEEINYVKKEEEINLKNEASKKSVKDKVFTDSNETLNLKQENIIPKKSESGIKLNLPNVDDVAVGLIESKNKDKIK